MKVLIVEDDDISRKILIRILSQLGACDAVIDGAEAVEAFELAWEDNDPYDLLLMDIMMPEVDGQEALKHIRKIERQMGIRGNKEVKVIMLTALEDAHSVVEAFYRGGATSYLVKPIGAEQLMIELKKLNFLSADQEKYLMQGIGKINDQQSTGTDSR